MKGIKKISLLALGFAFVGVAAGYGVKTFADTNYVEFDDLDTEIGEISTLEQPDSFPDIYINEDNKMQYHLQGISVNTDNARTTFYLGEEFSADGLLVLADFIKLDDQGNPAKDENGRTITVKARVTNYQVNSSEVDTNTMGYYIAQVSYRYGETVKTAEYDVAVKSSEFETTRNLVYIAGVKAGYKSEEANSNLKLKNDGRIATTYLRSTHANDFALDVSQLKVQIIQNTVNRVASAYTSEVIDFDLTSLTNDTTNKKMYNVDNSFILDYSAVDTGTVGSYVIPIYFKSSDIIVNGRTVENKVQSFIVVDVISPITRVVNTNNNMTVEASMDLPDFGKYQVNVARKVWNPNTQAFGVEASKLAITSNAFRFENIVTYSQGGQNGRFIVKEIGEDENGDDKEFSFEASITVTASTKYNISVVRDISTGEVVDSSTATDGKITYNEYNLGNGVNAYKVGVGKLNKNNVPEYLDKGKTCLSDGLSFTGFLGLDSFAKKSYIEFTFTKKTTLILYIGSNGDDDRAFAVYDSNNDNAVIYEGTAEVAVAGAKQTPVRFVLELDPGVYKVSALGSTVTFHGYVIGTLKEAE